LLLLSPEVDGSAKDEARLLLDTMESLLQPVEDFRCEYEGTLRARGKVAQSVKVREDSVFDSYGGVFIWKKGGDTRIEGWHRQADGNRIRRESTVVRIQDHRAEQHSQFNDQSVGSATISDPKDVRTWLSTMGTIFMLDKIKREIADSALDASVSDDQVDGRPLKVLSISIMGLPDSLLSRYWIDLRRNGHVVRREDYLRGNAGSVVSFRLEVALASFRVDNSEVWMPVSGESVGYAAMGDRVPVVMKAPQVFEKLYVVNGTMEFNKHPGPDVFTIRYRPGTPISDAVRRMQYEFGQQKIGVNPSRSEVEKMLKEQLSEARKQKAELVVADASEGSHWSSWLAWVFGAAAAASLVAFQIQRRRH
jgi:hypothetical protein